MVHPLRLPESGSNIIVSRHNVFGGLNLVANRCEVHLPDSRTGKVEFLVAESMLNGATNGPIAEA